MQSIASGLPNDQTPVRPRSAPSGPGVDSPLKAGDAVGQPRKSPVRPSYDDQYVEVDTPERVSIFCRGRQPYPITTYDSRLDAHSRAARRFHLECAAITWSANQEGYQAGSSSYEASPNFFDRPGYDGVFDRSESSGPFASAPFEFLLKHDLERFRRGAANQTPKRGHVFPGDNRPQLASA